jgi:acyl carrier protein
MREKILKFICKTTFSDPNNIRNNTLLFDEGIFDSMGLLNLISFLEEDFNIKVNDSDLDADNFGSIDSIVSFLERRLN